MNHIYRSIWSDALNTWIAVPEQTNSKGKHSNIRNALLITGLILNSANSWALPTGDQLMAGQASVSIPNTNTMQINQASQNAVINWQDFSIQQNQAVNIQQPNTQAALLNRVVGADASQIQGQLNANGQVYLVNPNGVIFSKTAQVDVGGLVATTHNISNQDFMVGKNHFTQDGATGTVENHGNIKVSEGGVVALIGTQVTNTGTITTPKGTTALSSGKTVDLDFKGDGLVEVKVTEAALNAQINNHGAIMADGGRVVLTAKAAGQLIDTVINQDGIIQAQGLVERNGEIILDGGDNGKVQVSGTLDTRSPNLGLNINNGNTNQGLNASGGNITVKGADIQLANSATVNASGNTGGGVITIGDKQTTHTSTIEDGATVSTQALDHGKAGTINVFANMDSGIVNVAGKLNASAPNNGDGGFIDTSAAHVKIADSAKISTKANNGNTGTWLIDPNDFIIGTALGNDITGLSLANNLGSSNVTITSSQGATIGNGDIFVNDAVSYASTNSLTLNAIRHVMVNQAITNTGSGTVNLRADSLGACVAGATNCGTINFASLGHITANTANLYYNPVGSNNSADTNGVGASYATPTDYSTNVTGTLNAYMLVNDVNQLQAMNTNLAGNYALGTDINASATSGWNNGAGFAPVGSFYYPTEFAGNFDGLSHTITGLMINRPTTNDVGLFGVIRGSISNVGMVGGSVTGSSDTGELVGFNDNGTISNSYATGSVTGSNYTGGLVGFNLGFNNSNGTISNSYATSSVTGSNYTGGLVGNNSDGTISNSYATGSVTGGNFTGGLVGENLVGGNIDGISNSYAIGSVTGSTNTGGLVGFSWGGGIHNAYYNIDQVLINGGHFVTPGGIYNAQYQDWFSHNKTLNISNYSTSLPLNASTGYYTIGSLQSLKDLLGFADNANYKFQLSTDIDLAAASGLYIPLLAGEFDGASHVIANLSSNPLINSAIGLFGQLLGTGVIKNVGLTDVSLTGDFNVGGLVGLNLGTISNSYTTGSVTGSSNIGGLVGGNASIYSTTGGGLRLINSGTISNSYSTSSVTGNNNSNIGGLVGGLVGVNAGTISNSYATGSVTTTGSYYTGGLVGLNDGTISNSYATGSVATTGGFYGGLVGYNLYNVIGTGGTISNSFWNTLTIVQGGQTNGVGYNTGTLNNVLGKTTAEMQQLATFSSAGWDISNTGGSSAVWRIYENYTAPLLRSFLAPLTVTSNAITKTYDGLTVNALSNSVFNPSVINSAHLLGTLNPYGSATNIGTYTATGLYSDQQGYDISLGNTLLTINPATLTYTANTASRLYGAANPILSGTVTGFVNGENLLSATTGTALFTSPASNTSNVGHYAINGSGLTANFGNYNFVQAASNTTSLSITPAIISLNGTRVYDGTVNVAASIFTLGGLLNGDVLNLIGMGSVAAPNVGSNKTVALNMALNNGTGLASNYTLTGGTYLANITPATLTYTANTASRLYGAANPAFSGTVTGFVNGEQQAAVTTGTESYASSATPASNVGTYAINGAGLTANNGNYTFAQATANGTALTINPALVTPPVIPPVTPTPLNEVKETYFLSVTSPVTPTPEPIKRIELVRYDLESQISPLQTFITFLHWYQSGLADNDDYVDYDYGQFKNDPYLIVGYETRRQQGKQYESEKYHGNKEKYRYRHLLISIQNGGMKLPNGWK